MEEEEEKKKGHNIGLRVTDTLTQRQQKCLEVPASNW